MKCNNCQKETNNAKFCSRSCANSYNNKIKPRKKLQGSCKSCSTTISAKRTYCKPCFQKTKFLDLTKTTKGSVKYGQKYLSNANARISYYARKVLKEQGITSCQNCGYDKHVEACHIKNVSSFPDNATLAEINSIDNLVGLCPNCHWEFDHNELDLTNLRFYSDSN